MYKHVFLRVFVFSLLAVLGGIYLSSLMPQQSDHVGYPWQIELLPSGDTRVFSLIIGQSTLDEAELLFKEKAKITLFMPPQSTSEQTEFSRPVIEAFFGEVKQGGLKSKMVMSMDIPVDKINAIYNRGIRIATLGSGTRKVTLSDDDARIVRQSVIASITYLPAVNLQGILIEKRFGAPAEKLADSESDAIHWLYPELGVDIVLSDTNKEVIQYVTPDKFDALVQPLRPVK